MTTELYINLRHYMRELIRDTEWEGHIYAVGGCCRDELMGHPIKDVDMAVDLPDGGIRFAKWLHTKGLTIHNPVTFPTYGTAMLRLRAFPDDEIELVQTRKEKYTENNRRNPEIVFGTIQEDCMLRDVTINSLYFDISGEKFIDITGNGISDIENCIIRTPADPDLTYDDDPLRILRCIRFASRYGWKIDAETFSGMCRNVDRLSKITRERKNAELDKMLTCDKPVMALKLLKDCGGMPYIIPELVETFDMTQNKYHFGTVWEHTLKVVESVPSDLTMRMAALLHDIGKVRTRTMDDNGNVHFLDHQYASAVMIKEILHRLGYGNQFTDEVAFLAAHHMDLKTYGDDIKTLRNKKLRKLQYVCYSRARFDRLLELIHADNVAHAENYCMHRQIQLVKDRTAAMEAEGSAMFGYKLPLNGGDVCRLKEISPGPQVKECLEYMLKLAFANPLRDKSEFEKHLIGYRLKK